MDILKLRTFCRVYELKSFSKAANDLFMSQPTVSSHILAIEKELQLRVFDRIGKSIIPTPAGDLLYSYAREMLATLDRVNYEIKLLKNEVIGKLKIGASTIPGTYILPSIVNGFLKKYPKVKLIIDISDTHNTYQKLINGEIDISVCGASSDHLELNTIKVLEDRLVFVGHKKFFKNIRNIEDIISIPWIIREKGSGTRLAVENELLNKNITMDKINIKCIVSNTQGVLSLVREGVGISVTSIYAARELFQNGDIVIKEFPFFDFKRNFYISYNKLRTTFPVTNMFIEYFIENSKILELEKNNI